MIHKTGQARRRAEGLKRVGVTLAFLGVLGTAFVVEAQTPPRVVRVGFIAVTADPSATPVLQAFRDGLRQLGWIEGRNLVLDVRVAGERIERVPGFVDDFARLRTDVIVTIGQAILAETARSTRTIPIVIGTGGDPVMLGVAQSLARPGGNVTGTVSIAGPEVFGKYLQFLGEAHPQGKRFVILWDSDPKAPHLAEMLRAAKTLGIDAAVREIRDRADVEATLASLTPKLPDAIFVLASGVNWGERDRIVDWTLKHRVPSMADIGPFVSAGLLLAYSMEPWDQLRRTAGYVDKILRGAKAGELPIEQPKRFELIVNRKTARAINLRIPASVLSRADRVID
jgi:putative ABC transport system substrate-binding protein